ncbi:MAG: LamG-like jellyroll fold domain-containing protein [Opitutales bacterium]
MSTTVMIASSLFSNGQSEPEIPAITRQVTTVEGNELTAPYIPAYRTSADGRLAMSPKRMNGQAIVFNLLVPERLEGHFNDSPNGAEIFWGASGNAHSREARHDIDNFWDLSHSDVSHPVNTHLTFYDNPDATNPYSGFRQGQFAGRDYYDMVMVTFAAWGRPTGNSATWKVPFYTEFTVEVTSPKTANARITDVEIGDPIMGIPFQADDVFEPLVTADGRLMIMRISTDDFVWEDPTNGTTQTSYQNVVYTYRSDPRAFTGPGAWQTYHPLSYAPYDVEINGTNQSNPPTGTSSDDFAFYGFAAHPFRDPIGGAIPRGFDFKANYPWIDRDGDNVVLTTIAPSLRDGNQRNNPTRYDVSPIPGVSTEDDILNNDISGISRSTQTKGHVIMGLWTQGKIVTMDNLLNNIDYGITVPDEAHMNIDLYEAGTGPYGGSGEVRIAAGRDNARGQPLGTPDNTTFFDSTEQIFNYDENMRPRTPRDVVWFVSSGTTTEEFAFDDYMHFDSFIVSHMNAAFSYGSTTTAPDRFIRPPYYDGWSGNQDRFFPEDIRFENSGTALPSRWRIPTYATTFPTNNDNDIRVEPVAMGGINGKGLWLDGDEGIRYRIPNNQPAEFSEQNWYYGIYLDCRFDNDTRNRTVLAFPDGSQLRLRGRDEVIYFNGGIQHVISLPSDLSLPRDGWSHLALQVFNGGSTVDFYLNGFLFDRWDSTTTPLFQLQENGNLDIGRTNNNGFVGWIDEFKVFADTFNPEVIANLAGGTLVGFNDEDNPSIESRARLFESWAHDEISTFLAINGEQTYDFYAVHYNYLNDTIAHPGDRPASTVSLRSSILFPESPLFHDAERPESAFNQFCLDCHGVDSTHGLNIGALSFQPGVNASDDARRQPMQPNPFISGNIPQNWIHGSPASSDRYISQSIDEWLLATHGGEPQSVTSFTLIDAHTQQPIEVLTDGLDIDPDITDTSSLTIRAVLDSEQGDVDLRLIHNGVDRVTTFTSEISPHAIFGTTAFQYVGEPLAPGEYTIQATPDGGTMASVTFTIGGPWVPPLPDPGPIPYWETYADPASDPDTLGLWHMTASEVGTGSQMIQLVGNASRDNVSGVSYSDGLNFGGGIDSAQISDVDTGSNSSFTVEAWLKFSNATPEVDQHIFRKWNNQLNLGYLLYRQPSGRWQARIGGGGDQRHIFTTSDSIDMAPDEWHHVAISWSQQTYVVTIWINGQAYPAAPEPGFIFQEYADEPLILGNDEWSPTEYHFEGTMDILRISTVARSFLTPAPPTLEWISPVTLEGATVETPYNSGLFDKSAYVTQGGAPLPLEFNARSLPGWMDFHQDATYFWFSGTPSSAAVGIRTVRIIASSAGIDSETSVEIIVHDLPSTATHWASYSDDPYTVGIWRMDADEFGTDDLEIAIHADASRDSTSGRFGAGLTLNAGHDRASISGIAIPGTVGPSPAESSFTLEAWVNIETLNTGSDQYLFEKWSAGDNTGYRVFRMNSGGWRVIFGDGNERYAMDISPLSSIQADQWYHIAVCWNHLTHTLGFFLDGALVQSEIFENVVFQDSNADLHIGNDRYGNNANAYHLHGRIDEIRISSIARNFVEGPPYPYGEEFVSWADAHGVGYNPDNNPDGDPWSNGIEYMFGMNPNAGDNQIMEAHAWNPVRPIISYTYRNDAAIEYVVERSQDLEVWTEVSRYDGSTHVHLEVAVDRETDNGDGTTTLRLRSNMSYDQMDQQFFRIYATMLQP